MLTIGYNPYGQYVTVVSAELCIGVVNRTDLPRGSTIAAARLVRLRTFDNTKMGDGVIDVLFGSADHRRVAQCHVPG
jgi:hypothetical protein